MPPEPPVGWDGVRDALSEGNVCLQKSYSGSGLVGDEDCLFLNVYTPSVPALGQTGAAKAVMVWIHGGAFTTGSGNADRFGPDYLIREDIVLVTINYRLGALGFLSLEDGVLPGNAGMKDQVEALRWVRRNIGHFGGDPGRVTIFGQSAGAASVHLHTMSPMSAGLFHGAISQSGCALNNWSLATGARQSALRLGKELGCHSDSLDDLLQFLTSVPASSLVDAQYRVVTNELRLRMSGVVFTPVVEKNSTAVGTTFLPDEPLALLKAGRVHKVPQVIGFNSKEGIWMWQRMSNQPAFFVGIDKNFEFVLPNMLGLQPSTEKSKTLAARVKKHYFGEQPVSEHTQDEFVELATDQIFAMPIRQAVQLQAARTAEKIYHYHFVHDGKLGHAKRFLDRSSIPGVTHSDELGYLFLPSRIPVSPEPSDVIVMKHMVRMWTNFAKTGDPNIPNKSEEGVTWVPFSQSEPNCLEIDERLVLRQDVRQDHFQLWDEVVGECDILT
ncbi:esterase FE4-like isoform X2 [Bacillus rossius redtenbacheri]|uniref:esterase FE4-like isoform X2 n=1 Tax=Bacillus rossius redtenbacheri TaxID=93214 RepID=UPI002FDCB309